MTAQVFSRICSAIVLVVLFPCDASPQSQLPTKRPIVGVALLTRDGALAATAVGCLKALEDLNVPVDRLSGANTGALVASLYATGHSYQAISDGIGELGYIYSDEYSVSPNYASDFRLRRFLTLQLGRFDLLADNDFSKLPIAFSTSAEDLATGDHVVFTSGSLANAVRVSMSSPLFLEPVHFLGKTLVSGPSGLVALLRSAGADIVIAVVDGSLLSRFSVDEWGAPSKQVVMDSLSSAAYVSQVRRDLTLADVVISVDTDAFSREPSRSNLQMLVDVGYRTTMDRKQVLGPYGIGQEANAERKVALDKYYRSHLAVVDSETLASIDVDGNQFVPRSTITDASGLRPGARFGIEAAVNAADKVYAMGFFRSCWLSFKRLQGNGVRVVLNVKESDSLPVDSLPKLEESLNSSNPRERLFAAVAIFNLGPKARETIPRLAELLNDESHSVRSAAARALGGMGREASARLPNLLTLMKKDLDLSVTKDAAWAISRIAVSLRTADDLRAISTLEESLRVLTQSTVLAEYEDSVRLSLKFLTGIRDAQIADSSSELSLEKGTIPSWLASDGDVYLNGERVRAELTAAQTAVHFLGGQSNGTLRQGINRIVRGEQQFTFWLEEQKLIPYESPYKNSFAVIAAIDDYERKGDPLHRPPTGYPALGGMVDNAQKLTEILQKVGFLKSNIVTLFDKDASSDAIDNALKAFWPGGRFAQADRVFFYFGGHGDRFGLVPYLVTYDFDKGRPTLTSTLMKDLTDRQSQNILAKHVLFALDACESGLSLRTLGSPEGADQQARRFQTLSVVRRDTEQIARNVLVAGTGDQRALWQNGGIFTKALIDGLEGEADLNQDGLIEFEELGIYIRNRVTAQAARTGVRQDPDFRVLDQFGEGRMVFLK